MNIIERSLAKKADFDTVTPREWVKLEPSAIYLSEKSAVSVINEFYELGYQKVYNPEQATFTYTSSGTSNEWTKIKTFCEVNELRLVEKGEGFLDNSLFHHQNSLYEEVIAGVDMDIATVGAYGAIPLRISPTSMARCLGTGTVEMMIPETVYVEINGRLSANADSIYEFLLEYFHDSLVGYGIIIGGNTIEQLELEARRSITRFTFDTGATLGMISPMGPLGQVESVIKINAAHIPKHLRAF